MPDPISQEDTTMDAIQFLKQEHQTAKAEFEKVLQASPKARGGLWQKLSPELEAHEQIEDACLYEPLSREAGGKDPKLAGWRQRHQDEVDEVEDLISEIEARASAPNRRGPRGLAGSLAYPTDPARRGSF